MSTQGRNSRTAVALGVLSTIIVAAAIPSLWIRLRPPDPGTGRVAGRTSYLLAETGFERSLSERAR